MKKLILAGAVAALLTACAGVSGLMTGGNSQIKDMAVKSQDITARFAVALDESAISYTSVMYAVGNETEAERIKKETENLRTETDKDKLEAAMGMLNEVDISGSLANAEELSDEGKAQITNAILHLGIAIYYDTMIGKDAADLVTDAKNVASNLSASDALAVGEVNTIITNASWTADIAPDQLALLKKSFDGLSSYAAAHGIEIPSQEEIVKQAESIVRE